jgi:hypothetical protein
MRRCVISFSATTVCPLLNAYVNRIVAREVPARTNDPSATDNIAEASLRDAEPMAMARSRVDLLVALRPMTTGACSR